MLAHLYSIDVNLNGRLAIMAHPPGGDALAPALAQMSRHDVSVLVSFLTKAEIRTLELEAEQSLFEASGGAFRTFPIKDRGVPDDIAGYCSFVDEIYARICCGQSVAMHCWGGIGRSGLTACAVRAKAGLAPAAAITQVSRARGCESPETPEQCRFLETYFALDQVP